MPGTDLGYATLRFDMRGCGDSQGARGRVICLEQVEDTKSALSFLAGRPEVDAERIGVIGHSWLTNVQTDDPGFLSVHEAGGHRHQVSVPSREDAGGPLGVVRHEACG